MEIIINWMRKQLLFIITLSVLLGVGLGIGVSVKLWNWRMGEVVKVGGFLYDNKVYEVRERIIISK